MTERWVIGRGLLGRAVERALGLAPVPRPIRWHHPDDALDDLGRHAGAFVAGSDDLEIYWCAGRGVTSTPESELEVDVEFFRRALGLLSRTLPGRRIRFFLASSVGGAYAMAPAPPFTEETPDAPGSAYGRAKLAMEAAVREHARTEGWRVFIARITNLYGPGQDLAKGQGLISVITNSFVQSSPVSLYVSLDTLRDYVYEDDCARVIVAAMTRLRDEPDGRTVMKIVGTMSAISIGALLGEATRPRRQRSQIMLGQGRSTGQASDLRVRSLVWPDLDALVRTTLPEGLDKVFRARLAEHAAGRA